MAGRAVPGRQYAIPLGTRFVDRGPFRRGGAHGFHGDGADYPAVRPGRRGTQCVEPEIRRPHLSGGGPDARGWPLLLSEAGMQRLGIVALLVPMLFTAAGLPAARVSVVVVSEAGVDAYAEALAGVGAVLPANS